MKYLYLLPLVFLFACSATDADNDKSDEDDTPKQLRLETINLPEGFEISVFAQDLKNARSMTLSPSGTLFVGTRKDGNVYALRDNDGDFDILLAMNFIAILLRRRFERRWYQT